MALLTLGLIGVRAIFKSGGIGAGVKGAGVKKGPAEKGPIRYVEKIKTVVGTRASLIKILKDEKQGIYFV